jgi:two-component system nitrate/nitrite response regulator NarL
MIKVLVVADDPITRAGLTSLLDEQEDLMACGQVRFSELATDQVNRLHPDLILVEQGQLSIQELLANRAALEVEWPLLLIGSGFDTVRRWTSSGLSVIGMKAGSERVSTAIRAVYEGLLVIDSDLLQNESRSDFPADFVELEPLTERELQVLRHLAGGLTNRAIALQLGISENTVKYHVNAILGKYGARSRTEAVVRAVQAGILPV